MAVAMLPGDGFLETLLGIGGLNGCDEVGDFTLHDAIQIVKGHPDTVLCETILREIVGPDLFLASTRADLALSVGGVLLSLLIALLLE